MMAQAAYRFCLHRNMTIFGLVQPNEKDSYLDEVLSYLFAGIGFYVQFNAGFKLPYILSLPLFPFSLAEYYIKWTITKKTI